MFNVLVLVSDSVCFLQVEKAHDADLHCVDWNPHDNNLILTGYLFYTLEYLSKRLGVASNSLTLFSQILRSADNTVRLFDRRNLTSNGVGSPIYKFEGHKASVLSVQVSTTCGYLGFIVISFLLLMSCTSSPMTLVLLSFQWSPDKLSVFGSSAEDGLLNIWDYDRVCTFPQIYIENFFITFKLIIFIYIRAH